MQVLVTGLQIKFAYTLPDRLLMRVSEKSFLQTDTFFGELFVKRK